MDTVLSEFPGMTMLLFGVILIVVITALPNGIMGLFTGLWQRRKQNKEAALISE